MIEVAAAVIQLNNKVLIAKRPADKHQGNKWEFPGGKIEPGETALDALKREIKEEINLDIIQAQLWQTVEHEYNDKFVRLYFYQVTEFSGNAEGMEGQDVCWVSVDGLKDYQFPEANKKIVDLISNIR